MKWQKNHISDNKGQVIINQQEIHVHVHVNTSEKKKLSPMLRFMNWMKGVPGIVIKYLKLL